METLPTELVVMLLHTPPSMTKGGSWEGDLALPVKHFVCHQWHQLLMTYPRGGLTTEDHPKLLELQQGDHDEEDPSFILYCQREACKAAHLAELEKDLFWLASPSPHLHEGGQAFAWTQHSLQKNRLRLADARLEEEPRRSVYYEFFAPSGADMGSDYSKELLRLGLWELLMWARSAGCPRPRLATGNHNLMLVPSSSISYLTTR